MSEPILCAWCDEAALGFDRYGKNPSCGRYNHGASFELDRELVAAHDAEVARKTLEDAADEFAANSANRIEEVMPSGHRFVTTEDWLRARAASISTDKAGEK